MEQNRRRRIRHRHWNSAPPPPPPRYRLTQTRPLAWLRLGKVAVFSILAGLSIAGGMAFPAADAAAQGAHGGYTYSQRVCQEYGQQPRWYNVRDGQAAYNGGNTDSGWLIVMERGASRVVSYPESADGAYVKKLNSDPAEYIRFIPDAQGDPQRVEWNTGSPGYYSQAPLDGEYVRIGTGWDHAAFVRALPSPWDPLLRYARTETILGGSYIRWAHMMWCR